MNASANKLLWELRQTKAEIEQSLSVKQKGDWLRLILEEELADVNIALSKMEEGNFGQCEISGEFFPSELLQILPTIRTIKDPKSIGEYYKKSF